MSTVCVIGTFKCNAISVQIGWACSFCMILLLLVIMFVVPYSRIKYTPIRAFSIPLNMSTLMYLFDTYRIQFY